MHKYDKNYDIVDTIMVGPILTTLCADSEVHLCIFEKHKQNFELVKLEQVKTYFACLKTEVDVAKLKQEEHAFFSRYCLYYNPRDGIPRDTKKDTAGIPPPRLSDEIIQEKFEKWEIKPGLRGHFLSNMIPNSIEGRPSRAAAAKRTLYNVTTFSTSNKRNCPVISSTPPPNDNEPVSSTAKATKTRTVKSKAKKEDTKSKSASGDTKTKALMPQCAI